MFIVVVPALLPFSGGGRGREGRHVFNSNFCFNLQYSCYYCEFSRRSLPSRDNPPMSLSDTSLLCRTNALLKYIPKFRLSWWIFKTNTIYALDICTLLCLQTQEPVPLCKNSALVTVLQISSFLSSLGWRIISASYCDASFYIVMLKVLV